jgi:hypothetical protein
MQAIFRKVNHCLVFTFIQLPNRVTDLGGDEEWVFQYTDVVDGENGRFKDEKTKQEWRNKRALIRERFEESTEAWIRGKDETARFERERITLEYRIASIEADPYLRPRSVYHRHGNFIEDGTVAWHYKSASESQGFGVSLSAMKRELTEASTEVKGIDNPALVVGDAKDVGSDAPTADTEG